MFGDYGKELLRSGIIDAKAGNRESARRYLDRAVYISQDHDVLAEAWFWMSEVLDEESEKRKALENCLAHDLRHAPRPSLPGHSRWQAQSRRDHQSRQAAARARGLARRERRTVYVSQVRRADEFCARWTIAIM